MKAFAYKVATSEESAVKLLGEKALALAGGTSILNLMKNYVLEPEVLVDVKRIPGLARIEVSAGGLRLGANVRLTDLLESPAVKALYPGLHEAVEQVATPQIRNMSTLAGNLCQRPSCWYFTQEAFDCLKHGGSTCPARAGENEYHAIFGNDGPCVMVHPSSMAPALVVLDASVRVAGPSGAREVPIEEFFVLPSVNAQRENVLAPNEIVTHVTLGAASPKSATYVVRSKEANDWPVGLASVSLQIENGACTSARVCLGAVAPTPWRAPAAEAALQGKPVTEETAAA
ncbi:MAG TPA: xanthine dehydrogenase family protein subunit M, partial [Planctomycetota bacterium]|nr:xanthine dehydrogenase family protein subunit M [Planctomycetota bacterium]